MWNFILKFLCFLLPGSVIGFEDLWSSCSTKVCGGLKTRIICPDSSVIFINNVTSGQAFRERSFQNLRRMCMGMSSCSPHNIGFCYQHHGEELQVTYICVKEYDIEKDCLRIGKDLSEERGFLTNPNYPAETSHRECSWRIPVPEGYMLKIFLHELEAMMSHDCLGSGLVFRTSNSCSEVTFPTKLICNEQEVNHVVTSCGDTEIIMDATGRHPFRFWLSYQVAPISKVETVGNSSSMYDVDKRCVARAPPTIPKTTDVIQQPPAPTENVPGESFNITIGREISQGMEDNENLVIYIGAAVGLLLGIGIIIVVVLIHRRVKRRRILQAEIDEKKKSKPQSDNNVYESVDKVCDESNPKPILQETYSNVVDEIPVLPTDDRLYSATYAEIEDSGDIERKAKKKNNKEHQGYLKVNKLIKTFDNNLKSVLPASGKKLKNQDCPEVRVYEEPDLYKAHKEVPEIKAYAAPSESSPGSSIYVEIEDSERAKTTQNCTNPAGPVNEGSKRDSSSNKAAYFGNMNEYSNEGNNRSSGPCEECKDVRRSFGKDKSNSVYNIIKRINEGHCAGPGKYDEQARNRSLKERKEESICSQEHHPQEHQYESPDDFEKYKDVKKRPPRSASITVENDPRRNSNSIRSNQYEEVKPVDRPSNDDEAKHKLSVESLERGNNPRARHSYGDIDSSFNINKYKRGRQAHQYEDMDKFPRKLPAVTSRHGHPYQDISIQLPTSTGDIADSTSSDSEDSIIMVENELYEPFETAKV